LCLWGGASHVFSFPGVQPDFAASVAQTAGGVGVYV
jgi:hypothetical protein